MLVNHSSLAMNWWACEGVEKDYWKQSAKIIFESNNFVVQLKVQIKFIIEFETKIFKKTWSRTIWKYSEK